MDDWLKNLKAGDPVIFDYDGHEEARTVEKITPKGFIKVAGQTFNPDGTHRGNGGWHGFWIYEATPEHIQRLKDKEMINNTIYRIENKIGNTESLTVDQWRRIKAILDESETEK